MTNEEAIIYLERADTTVYKEIKTKTAEALEIAIKALEQTDKIEESNFSTEQYKADLQGAYDCGYAKALEQQTGWIPVSERLPMSDEEYHTFLVTDSKGNVALSEFYLSISDKKPYWSGMIDVKAWMPLPEPYKEDAE